MTLTEEKYAYYSESVKNAIRTFEKLGFRRRTVSPLPDEQHQSPITTPKKVSKWPREEKPRSLTSGDSEADYMRNCVGMVLNPDHPWFHVHVANYFFADDIWSGDPECDVMEENKCYERVLRELASISRGTFAPKNIQERWATKTGPIEVRFDLPGRHVCLIPQFLDDYLDFGFLHILNDLIEQSGSSFSLAHDENSATILCLTEEQKALLWNETAFPFIEREAEQLDIMKKTPFSLQ